MLGCEVLEARQVLSADAAVALLDCGDVHDELSQNLAQFAPVAVPFAQSEIIVNMSDPVAEPMAGTANPSGFTPAQLKQAYGFNQLVFANGTIQGDGTGQTIAIVNAFHTPTALADLTSFSAHFGLPMPPSFVQVAQDGSTNYPTTSSNWALETALDIQWAHALAPGANILLVEANSATFADLSEAVDYARNQPGVSVVSLSWGAPEWSTQNAFDTYFTTPLDHNGVVFAAAAGNSGSPGAYPAFSPNTLAVGGTTLSLNAQNNIQSETSWNNGGGGISQYSTQPSWQQGFVTQSATQRTSPDVSFLGNPNSGVPVYDTFNNSPGTPWSKVGGTSFATPSWAALVAIADQGRSLNGLPTLSGPELMTMLYAMPASYFNDIVSGPTSNGTTPQTPGPGYDLNTGRGSPKANLIVPTLVGTATISGKVYNDANANGSLDGGEAGLSGITVYADTNNNGVLDAQTTQTFASADVPKTISAGGPSILNSNAVVSGLAGNVIDVNVTLNISHNRASDLVLTLISPDGTRITLANRVTTSTGKNFTNTKFDDSAPVTISNTFAPFNGTFRPVGSLSASLLGKNPNGIWTLEVQDAVTLNGGTLNSWSLQLTAGDVTGTTDANGNYELSLLTGGSYNVRANLPGGYGQTAPVGGVHNVSATVGLNATGRNFGLTLPPSTMPSGISLSAASDTGLSNADRVTKLNNSSPGAALQFEVSGTVAGATVTIYADGNPIGSTVASGSTTTVLTNGSFTLADGARSITARQTEPGKPISANSPAISVTVDTVAPVASITPVTPNPRNTPVAQMTLSFGESVSGLELSHLALTRDAGANLLSGSQSVTSGNGISWTLSDLTLLTTATGVYQLAFSPEGAPIIDIAGNAVANSTTSSFTVSNATIVGRRLFYNQSTFDGNTAGVSSNDDAAIATDKTALLPGGQATFSNISSYSRGINGIMIDLAGPHGAITAADFTFKVGANNSPAAWSSGPAPVAVSVRSGAGLGGSDRVEILWANNAIQNTWLQITVAANANTGLANSDVFYFGNLIGDSGAGDTASLAITNPTDELAARGNPGAANVTNPYDFNRDGFVTPTDSLIVRSNVGLLPKINPAASPPAPPIAPSAETSPPANEPQSSTTKTDPGIVFALAGKPSAPHDVALEQALSSWLSNLDERLLDVLAAARRRLAARR